MWSQKHLEVTWPIDAFSYQGHQGTGSEGTTWETRRWRKGGAGGQDLWILRSGLHATSRGSSTRSQCGSL